MKTRQVTIEIVVCDACGKDCDYPRKCIRCGNGYCYNCDDAQLREYTHSVHCSGSGDAIYCLACDTELKTRGDDPEYNAYTALERIKEEGRTFNRSWTERAEKLEKLIDRFYRDRESKSRQAAESKYESERRGYLV